MAATTTDYKAINTQIVSVRPYSKKCAFSVGNVILNSNIQETSMFISTQRFVDFSMKLKSSLINEIFSSDEENVKLNKSKYISLFDKSISNILKMQAEKYSVETTEDGILFSLKNRTKTAYIDVLFDDDNILYSLISKSESQINNYTDTMNNSIININIFFKI